MSLVLNTLDHLFKIQKNIDNDCRLSSYYRWLLNNRCDQYQSRLAIHPESKIDPNKNNKELKCLSEICPNCWSSMAKFRLIPKKTKHKKRMKKGNNFDYNIMNTECKNCKSKFNFKALSRSQPNKHPNRIMKTNNISASKLINKRGKGNERTPLKSQSSKEILQKLLINSKKKRNLNDQTKLSNFLENCFDN